MEAIFYRGVLILPNLKTQYFYEALQSDTDTFAGLPGGSVVKNPPANAGDARDTSLIPGLERPLGVRNGSPLQVFWPEKFHGQRSLGGVYTSWSCKESSTTEHMHALLLFTMCF